jgi:hypothetical protein
MRKSEFGRIFGLGIVLAMGLPATGTAQEFPRPEDVATPEAAIAAAYASLKRAPGEDYDWDRFRSLHLPEAILIPNTEQTGGEFRVLTVQGFIDWVDGFHEQAPIGGPQDQGFEEAGVHSVKNEYGDIVQILSTYEKHFHGQDQVLGRGINAFTVVHHDDRWWIASIAWDEEDGAGPIPKRYMP